MTLIKTIHYELREGRPSLTTRIFADHPDRNRAEQWPDPNALTRAQALHLVHAIQAELIHLDSKNGYAPRVSSLVAPGYPVPKCSPANS